MNSSTANVIKLPRRRPSRAPVVSDLPFGAGVRPGPEDPTATVQLQAILFPERSLGEHPVTAQKVRKIRGELGLNQRKFGCLLNASAATVQRWESGAGVTGPWIADVLVSIGMVLDHHTVGDSVRLSLHYRGAVATLQDLLSHAYVQ